jgi:hypothetical protein
MPGSPTKGDQKGMSDKLDQTAGSESYQAGNGEMAMPTNGGNYGTTPAPEGSGSVMSPQGETDFTPGPGKPAGTLADAIYGTNSTAKLPT